MAFVRWRKHCAQLLCTRYEGGRARQVLMASLGEWMYVPIPLQQAIEARFPDVKVDWAKVDTALARGGKADPEPPAQHMRLAQVEHRLRSWARHLREREGGTRDVLHLEAAAEVLTGLRQNVPFWEDDGDAAT